MESFWLKNVTLEGGVANVGEPNTLGNKCNIGGGWVLCGESNTLGTNVALDEAGDSVGYPTFGTI